MNKLFLALAFLLTSTSWAQIDGYNRTQVILNKIRAKMSQDGSAYSALMFSSSGAPSVDASVETSDDGYSIDFIAGAGLKINAINLRAQIPYLPVVTNESQGVTMETEMIGNDLILITIDKKDFESSIPSVNRGLSAFACSVGTSNRCIIIPSSIVLRGGAVEGLVNGPYLSGQNKIVETPSQELDFSKYDIIEELKK